MYLYKCICMYLYATLIKSYPFHLPFHFPAFGGSGTELKSGPESEKAHHPIWRFYSMKTYEILCVYRCEYYVMYTWKYTIYHDVPWTYRIRLQELSIKHPQIRHLSLEISFQWDVVLKWKMSVVPPDGTSQKNRYGREMKAMILYQQIISMNFVFACSAWIKTIGFRSKCMALMTLKHFAPHDSNIDCVFSTCSQHDAPLGTLRLVRSTRHEASQHALESAVSLPR